MSDVRNLTDSEWTRFSLLCAQLQILSPDERAAAVASLRTQGDDEPQVLSLVALHFVVPLAPDRLRVGEWLGEFFLEECIGAGGMGVVYRAQQAIGDGRREVALKLIRPDVRRDDQQDARSRFQAEITNLGTLQHKGIPRIYMGGIYEPENLPYIVMELVRGGDPLTTYIRDHALTIPERLALFLQVCDIVLYAHEHRVIHRDLKPANILVDHDGAPVIIDFGLAQVYERAWLPGAVVAVSGTLGYMSPEQVSSDAFGEVTYKSDTYALGVILYELLTDQHPYASFGVETFEQCRHVITELSPPSLTTYHQDYQGELADIVALALAKQPRQRLSVAVLRSRIARCLQQLPQQSSIPRYLSIKRLLILVCLPLLLVLYMAWQILTDNYRKKHDMGYLPPVVNSRGAILSLYAVKDACSPTYPVDTCPEKVLGYNGAGMYLRAGHYYLEAQDGPHLVQYPVYIAGYDKEAKTMQVEIPRNLHLPPGMAFIPAGWFRMGDETKEGEADEQPLHDKDIPAFFIDKHEVKSAAYKQFIAANGYNTQIYWDEEGWAWRRALAPETKIPLPQRWQDTQEADPITRVTWYEASAYCRWKEKRLPTEAEWEKAARGPRGYLYVYSNEYEKARDWVDHQNGYGLLRTLSGVREWVADKYTKDYKTPPQEGALGIMRGATSMDAKRDARISRRWSYPREFNHSEGGLRCAQSYQALSSP